jgi:hypothetical protein
VTHSCLSQCLCTVSRSAAVIGPVIASLGWGQWRHAIDSPIVIEVAQIFQQTPVIGLLRKIRSSFTLLILWMTPPHEKQFPYDLTVHCLVRLRFVPYSRTVQYSCVHRDNLLITSRSSRLRAGRALAPSSLLASPLPRAPPAQFRPPEPAIWAAPRARGIPARTMPTYGRRRQADKPDGACGEKRRTSSVQTGGVHPGLASIYLPRVVSISIGLTKRKSQSVQSFDQHS